MFDKDRIERGLYWDKALNLVYGCTRVSEGCDNCWARREAHMRRSNPNPNIKDRYISTVNEDGSWTGSIVLMDKNLELPQRRKKPTVWAVWNDLFHPDVDSYFIHKTLGMMEKCREHLFLILTKRPLNAKNYMGNSIGNIMFGVTIESGAYLHRIISDLGNSYYFERHSINIFLSIEPLLERIPRQVLDIALSSESIKWVIVGGESGPHCRPMNLDWAREIREVCLIHRVPFFFKQVGGHPNKKAYYKDIPVDLQIRELPIRSKK